jgi:hypothetical protein
MRICFILLTYRQSNNSRKRTGEIEECVVLSSSATCAGKRNNLGDSGQPRRGEGIHKSVEHDERNEYTDSLVIGGRIFEIRTHRHGSEE